MSNARWYSAIAVICIAPLTTLLLHDWQGTLLMVLMAGSLIGLCPDGECP
jgi:hypothetical protein